MITQNTIISASIGVVKTLEGCFYLQVLSADKENEFFVHITPAQAKSLRKEEDLFIDYWINEMIHEDIAPCKY